MEMKWNENPLKHVIIKDVIHFLNTKSNKMKYSNASKCSSYSSERKKTDIFILNQLYSKCLQLQNQRSTISTIFLCDFIVFFFPFTSFQSKINNKNACQIIYVECDSVNRSLSPYNNNKKNGNTQITKTRNFIRFFYKTTITTTTKKQENMNTRTSKQVSYLKKKCIRIKFIM